MSGAGRWELWGNWKRDTFIFQRPSPPLLPHRHTHIFNKEPEADSILTPFPQRTPWERGCKRGQRGSWGGNGAAFSPGCRQSMHLPGRDLARQVSGELGWGGGRAREPRTRPGGWLLLSWLLSALEQDLARTQASGAWLSPPRGGLTAALTPPETGTVETGPS